MRITKDDDRLLLDFSGTILLTKNYYAISIDAEIEQERLDIDNLTVIGFSNCGFWCKIKVSLGILKFVWKNENSKER